MFFIILIILGFFMWRYFQREYELQNKRNILIIESHLKQNWEDEHGEKIETVEYIGKSKLALHFKVVSISKKVTKVSAISSGLSYHFDEGWK